MALSARTSALRPVKTGHFYFSGALVGIKPPERVALLTGGQPSFVSAHIAPGAVTARRDHFCFPAPHLLVPGLFGSIRRHLLANDADIPTGHARQVGRLFLVACA